MPEVRFPGVEGYMIDKSKWIQLCGGGRCPRAFITEEGELIVQGILVDPEVKAQLDPLSNEEVVRLPKEVVQELLRHSTTD